MIISIASSVSQKQQRFENSISNRCQWCQLVYEIWNLHRFQYFSCNVQNQQTYEFVLQFFEKYTNEIVEQQKAIVLKIAKKIKINAIKNVKRIKSKTLKTKKIVKSTSTIQNIDIFDSIFIYENRRFNEFAKFLQHFQQCQHLYRKSNLFMLLFICFWNFAFDIWFDKQTIMKFTSLKKWIDILRIDFANVSFAKIKIANIICMRYDSNFNFKEKFRKHVREKHVKKFVNNSFFSFNTIKSICEIKKNSIVICLSNSSISQKFEISIATSKQIFHSKIFETIISSKYSHFTFNALEIVFELMKNTSIQCSFISSKSSFFQTIESEHHEFAIQKSEKKSSFFTIFSDKSICESEKNSIVINSFVSFISFLSIFKRNCFICRIVVISIKKHYFEYFSCHETLRYKLKQQFVRRTHQREQEISKQNEKIKLICLNFSIATFKIKSKSIKNVSNRKITCARVNCKLCKQNFNFNKKLYEHICDDEIQQSVKNFHFSINAVNLLCEIKKTSFVSHKLSVLFVKF